MSDSSQGMTSRASTEVSSSRIFALSFACLAFACVAIGSGYVWYLTGLPPVSDLFLERKPTDALDAIQYAALLIVIERFLPLLIIAFFALSFSRASISFVKAGEYNKIGVVPPRDLPIIEEAIKKGQVEPIDQYIRLSSLTGGIGVFQKIGLTGLPLTTLALVVFFALGVIISDDKSDTFKAFLDFTKLTLGAFIGSFVQRQVERRGQETDLQRAIQTAGRIPPDGRTP